MQQPPGAPPSPPPPPPPGAPRPGFPGVYDVPPPPPPRERKWLPVIVLTLVMVFVVLGGFVVAGAIGVPRMSAGARPVTVGGVRFQPEPGWQVAKEFPGEPTAVLLTHGLGNLLVADYPAQDDATMALDRYLDEVLASGAIELRVSQEVEPVPIGSGVTALRRFYVGTFEDNPAPIEGEVTAFVLSGHAVVFDGWAHQGSYGRFGDEVHRMIETTETG